MGNRTVYPRQVYQDGERAEAEFISSQRQLEVGNRNSFTTEVELDTFTRNVAVTQARYKQSLANYEFITIQHSYSKITAPMSGAIASVSTQQGETVAASFAAPHLLDHSRSATSGNSSLCRRVGHWSD